MGLAEWGRFAGLLHDVDKYADPFQAKLRGSSQRFDHSAPGASLAIDRYGEPSGKMLAFCHHAAVLQTTGDSYRLAAAKRNRRPAAGKREAR